MSQPENLKKAVFAGGCFWCMEGPFEAREGVAEVVSGYTGGKKENPTYEEVSSGTTGHLEAIEVTYDPARVSYAELLEIFWRQIDPTDEGGQFADRGSQYVSAVFYGDEEEMRQALATKEALEKSGQFEKPVVTKILSASAFYRAEEVHQDYHHKNPVRYRSYRLGSGRDSFLEKAWEKKTEEDLREKLTPLQYEVTQKEGTEPPFQNEYWDNKREGIYVDVVSGEPLFSSRDEFDSGTGWPSFMRPLKPENIVEREERQLTPPNPPLILRGGGRTRTEVKSKNAGSHLGHVFPDGPAPSGLRYCINSAALRFVPKENLEKEGYGEFLKLFEK